MMDETANQADSGAVGMRVVHRRYVPYAHAHYAGNLVDGAYVVALFGDVATELKGVLIDHFRVQRAVGGIEIVEKIQDHRFHRFGPFR